LTAQDALPLSPEVTVDGLIEYWIDLLWWIRR
jgi:hypothetical protein